LKERVIPLLEQEGNYGRLADTFLEEGKREEARKSCLVGYEKSLEKNGRGSEDLHKRLRNMAEEEGQYALAAAYYCDDFFKDPTESRYVALRDVVEKAGCWPVVREGALRFLETGTRPDRPGTKKSIGEKWPLPPTEVAHLHKGQKEEDSPPRNFPKREPLIRIAILEGRVDDMIELHRALPKGRMWDRWDMDHSRDLDNAVAHAAANAHPDVALSIWRSLVDTLIGLVKVDAYESATPYLRNMKSLYEEQHRLGEWKALIAELKKTHKLKRSLLKILAAIE
jgi:uncharacterized Zn finger protein